MITVVRNTHVDTSSNPRRAMNSTFLPSTLNK